MKKLKMFLILSLLVVLVFYGCSLKPNKTISEEERTTTLSELGITFTIPNEWTTNIISFTSVLPENEIFGEVKFLYGTDESLKIISAPDFNGNIEYFTTPIAKIIIIKTGEEGKSFENIKSEFNDITILGENSGYTYYVMSNYLGGFGKSTEKEKEDFDKKTMALQDFITSIKFNEFSADETIKAISDKNNTLTFKSKTIEGEQIDSTIFNDYDITMINFWGTYAYPDINEFDTLNKVNEKINELENVNFIQVIIDTPSKEAEDTVLKIKSENNISYKTISPDQNLASWIVNNLEGIPTTIFVNNKGVIISEKITGTKSVDEYLNILNQQIEILNQN